MLNPRASSNLQTSPILDSSALFSNAEILHTCWVNWVLRAFNLFPIKSCIIGSAVVSSDYGDLSVWFCPMVGKEGMFLCDFLPLLGCYQFFEANHACSDPSGFLYLLPVSKFPLCELTLPLLLSSWAAFMPGSLVQLLSHGSQCTYTVYSRDLAWPFTLKGKTFTNNYVYFTALGQLANHWP